MNPFRSIHLIVLPITRLCWLFLLALSALFSASHSATASPLERLRVSDNHRFLVTADGQPFFWLADTAWQLIHDLNEEETLRYLADRRDKGFNVIQTVVLAEHGGLDRPNAYQQFPLHERDPARPDVREGDDYWKRVDDSKVLMTYHTSGPGSTAWLLNDEPWLDFHALQSGRGRWAMNWLRVEHAYTMKPTLPVIDLETSYPGFRHGRPPTVATDDDARRAAWFDPRTDKTAYLATFDAKGRRTFDPPGEEQAGNDWVLVIETDKTVKP